jgi:methyl-accepting chemotaxis protein
LEIKLQTAAEPLAMPPKFTFKSISTKLFLLFFCAIVALVGIGGYTSYQISRSVVIDKVSNSTHETITQTTEKVDLFFSKYHDLFLQVLLDPELREALNQAEQHNKKSIQNNVAKENILKKLRALVSTNRGLAAVHFLPIKEVTLRQTEAATYSNYAVTYGFTQKPWFEQVLQSKDKLVWLEPVDTPYVMKKEIKVFALGKPYASIPGQVTHILLFEIEMDALLNQLTTKIGDEGKILISNPDNKVLHAAAADLTGQVLPFKIELPDEKSKDAPTEMFYTELNGEESLIVYRQSKLTDWLFIGMLPTEELVRDASKIFDNTIMIVIAAAVAAVLFSYLIVRMVGRPIANLNNLMKEGEQGNLSVRSDYRSGDEIGQLSYSFNQMMGKISELVHNTNASAAEVLNTAAKLAEASRRTSASAKSIVDASDQIASGSISLAENAERGNELARNIDNETKSVLHYNTEMSNSASEVQRVSVEGTNHMVGMMDKTNSTERIIRSMVEKVDHLKESTKSIRNVLDILTNMTKQTNMLALNASIEAARAGAHGRGFAVVANEVKNLADKSKQSINHVNEMTDTIQREVEETVAVLSDAYPIFQDQIHSVKQADIIFNNIQRQMEQFMHKLADTTVSLHGLQNSQTVLFEAINEVSAVSQETAAMTEEVTSSSNEQLSVSTELVQLSERLEALSNSLKDSLSKFNI